jgi:DNA invertase Pin-like site-specific DNA recombinase
VPAGSSRFDFGGYFGSSMNRPGIRALMRQIEAGEITIGLIFKLERVLRSTDEWGPFRSFLQKHGCRLMSPTEGLSEETPSGRLKNSLMMSVAEHERLNTAEKILHQTQRAGEARVLDRRPSSLRLAGNVRAL